MRDGTPPNKGKHLQTSGKHLQTRETPPNKGKPFQTRENLSKQGETPPNKGGHLQTSGKHHQTRKKIPFKQEKPQQARKRLSSKGYLPIKCKSLQVVGVSSQGKAVVSDGGYGVIGGGYCLLVWGDAEETKGKRGGGGGVGSAPLVVRLCSSLAVV